MMVGVEARVCLHVSLFSKLSNVLVSQQMLAVHYMRMYKLVCKYISMISTISSG
jgi:hypothetical protein